MEPIEARFRADPDLGHTRINFNYGNVFETSAALCDKPGRQQYCEGSNEIFWRRWLVVNVFVTDFQFQPIEVVFVDEHGRERKYYWDVGVEFVDGSIAFGEIKANRTFFDTATIHLVVEGSAAVLANEGIAFVRLMGTDFDQITKQTIKRVFDSQLVSYSEYELMSVTDAILTNRGSIGLGRAIDTIGGHRWDAEAKLCSMMTDRRIEIDIDLPLTLDHTKVRLAPEAVNPGALRSFLSRFAESSR